MKDSSPAERPLDQTARDMLLQLAKRCESEAPSRPLDAEIWIRITGQGDIAFVAESADGWVFGGDLKEPAHAPRYTTDFEAALTLVPHESDGWIAGHVKEYWHATVHNEEVWLTKGNAALALCAAALRARAALSSEGEEGSSAEVSAPIDHK